MQARNCAKYDGEVEASSMKWKYHEWLGNIIQLTRQ